MNYEIKTLETARVPINLSLPSIETSAGVIRFSFSFRMMVIGFPVESRPTEIKLEPKSIPRTLQSIRVIVVRKNNRE